MAYIQHTPLITTSNTKFIDSYSFNTTNGTVQINGGFDTILYIVDLAQDVVIYNPLQVGKGGSITGNTLTLNYPMDGLSDTDKLLIVADFTPQETVTTEIQLLRELMETNNKLLNKIYNPE